MEVQKGFLEDLLRLVVIGDDLIGHLEHQASVVLNGFGTYVGWSAQNFLSVWMGSAFVLYDPQSATM